MPDAPLKTTAAKPSLNPLNFNGLLLWDAIRRENHCNNATCAYADGCVCWQELQEECNAG